MSTLSKNYILVEVQWVVKLNIIVCLVALSSSVCLFGRICRMADLTYINTGNKTP